MLDKRVQMANGVVNIRPNVPFQVEVTNFGSKRKVLPKNMVIGSVGGSPHSTLCIDMHDKENVSTENVAETPDRCAVQTRSVSTKQGIHGKREPLANIPLQRRTPLDAETNQDPRRRGETRVTLMGRLI